MKPTFLHAILMALVLLQGCASNPSQTQARQFERELGSDTGAVGEVHGAYADLKLFVLTYRDPKDFFQFIDVSMIPSDREIAATMAGLHRHDRVRIKGAVLDNRSPQIHVEVTSIEVVKRYEAVPPLPEYRYDASIPAELENRNEALFLVHAIKGSGHVLVVEHKDAVLPIHVKRASLTEGLARNDVVRLRYAIREEPRRPVHLQLLEDEPKAIQMVDSAMALHGKPAVVEGALVMFPKSPQVRFNVFAVLQTLPDGLQRQFTLVNFDDEAKFEKLRVKAQAAWDTAPDAVRNGRNKLISTKVRVRVTGNYNAVDPNQPNVQNILPDEKALEILPAAG